MTVSRTELIGIVAILLYIVFFSHSPPYALRSALGNVYVAGTIFAALTYVTLRINQSIGVLMIVAFILTMTRVTEHLDAGATPPATPPPPPPFRAPTTGTTMDSQGNIVNSSGTIVQAAGAPTSTGVTAGATTAAAPAQAMPPVVAVPATVAAPTAPAVPGVTATQPKPVMSCNIESFAPF